MEVVHLTRSSGLKKNKNRILERFGAKVQHEKIKRYWYHFSYDFDKVGEGNLAIFKKRQDLFLYYGRDVSRDAIVASLKKYDIDETTWESVIDRLRQQHGVISKNAFEKEIEALNKDIFNPRGLVAVGAKLNS